MIDGVLVYGVDLSPKRPPTIACSVYRVGKECKRVLDDVMAKFELVSLLVIHDGDLWELTSKGMVKRGRFFLRLPWQGSMRRRGARLAEFLLITSDQIGLTMNAEKLLIVIGVEDVSVLHHDDEVYGGSTWDEKWYWFMAGFRDVEDHNGVELIEVNPRYTSLNCPFCNPPKKGDREITNPTFFRGKEREMAAVSQGLGPRGFYCPNCGFKAKDKDMIAAINIMLLAKAKSWRVNFDKVLRKWADVMSKTA